MAVDNVSEIRPNEELEPLQMLLKQAQSKVANWMVEELGQKITTMRNRHETVVKHAIAQKQELEEFLEEKQKEDVQAGKELQEKCRMLEQLKTELEKQCGLSQDIHQSIASEESEVDRLQAAVQEKKKAIEAPTKARQKLEYLEKASNVFGSMLGLSFKKTRGNNMQVIFTHIDEKDPLMLFYFFMQIEPATRKYIVTNPEPQVEGLNDLVAELNRTNNLRHFMIQMRQKFKDTVKIN